MLLLTGSQHKCVGAEKDGGQEGSTWAEAVAVLVEELVAGVEHVTGVVVHDEVEGGDARVKAKASVVPQLLPQLVAKCGVRGLRTQTSPP